MSLAWLNFKIRPTQFGDNKHNPGRKYEHNQALNDAPNVEPAAEEKNATE